MKPLFALLVTALLGIGVTACGDASKNTSATSRISSKASTASSAQTTTSSDAASQKSDSSPIGENGDSVSEVSSYGHSASTADKQAITNLVKRYYAAAAADNGVAACGLIYSILAESIAEDYGQPPGPPGLRGKTCEVVMSKLFRQIPMQPPAVLAATEVMGVRVNGRNGFAQLRSKAMSTGQIMVKRQQGSWKINALIGSACEKCAPS